MNLVRAISRHSWVVTATLLLVLPLISCSDDDGDVDDRLRELRRNRALWRLHAIDDYRFVQHKSCFCGGGYVDPMRVEVRGGSIVRVERISDARPLPASLALTVEDAFERIERAIDGEYEFLETEFDPEMGFSTEFYSNPGGDLQDGSFRMTSSELTRLGPSNDCDAPPMPAPCECPADYPTLNYRYTAWDESGAIVATGCAVLTFTVVPGSDPPEYDLTGDRCIAVRCVESASSAHQGSSAVAGRLEADGRLFLDLNAGTADRNIYLEATGALALGGYLSGTWGESTLIGVIEHGTFLLDRTSQ